MKEDRRIKKSKEALKGTLLTLMKKKRLSKITICELCEKANLNRSTFYANYSGINEIIEEIHNDIFYDMSVSLKTTFIDYDKSEEYKIKILKEIIEYLYQKVDIIRILLINNENNMFEKHLTEYFMKYYEIEKKDRIKRYTFLYHTMGSLTLILTWLLEDCPCTSEELASLIYEMSKYAKNSE